MKKVMLVIGTLLVLFVTYSDQLPAGAPATACSSITPNHPGTSSQAIPGGFYLYSDLIDAGGSYTASTPYTITLEGSIDFRGFLIQARTAGVYTPIGSFSTPTGTQHLTCSGVSDASVTHTSNDVKSSLTFTWTSPSGTGTVEFVYGKVRKFNDMVVDYSTYYANIAAAAHRPPSPTLSSAVSTSTPVPAPSSASAMDAPLPSTSNAPPLSSSKVISTSSVSIDGYTTTESTSSYAEYSSSVVPTSLEEILPTSLESIVCSGYDSLVCKRRRVQTICKALGQQGKDPLPEQCADAS